MLIDQCSDHVYRYTGLYNQFGSDPQREEISEYRDRAPGVSDDAQICGIVPPSAGTVPHRGYGGHTTADHRTTTAVILSIGCETAADRRTNTTAQPPH